MPAGCTGTSLLPVGRYQGISSSRSRDKSRRRTAFCTPTRRTWRAGGAAIPAPRAAITNRRARGIARARPSARAGRCGRSKIPVRSQDEEDAPASSGGSVRGVVRGAAVAAKDSRATARPRPGLAIRAHRWRAGVMAAISRSAAHRRGLARPRNGRASLGHTHTHTHMLRAAEQLAGSASTAGDECRPPPSSKCPKDRAGIGADTPSDTLHRRRASLECVWCKCPGAHCVC